MRKCACVVVHSNSTTVSCRLIFITTQFWGNFISSESAENKINMEEQQQMAQETGASCGNEKTSDYYKTSDIPNRFDNPDWFKGYGGKQQHPMYRTTANTYGQKAPSVHTMPTSFHCKSQKFSLHLGTCGMYRNHSLNTASDVSKV